MRTTVREVRRNALEDVQRKENNGPAAGSSQSRCGEHHMLYSRTADIPALRVWCVLGGPTPYSVECPSPVWQERPSVQAQASRMRTRRDRVLCSNVCTSLLLTSGSLQPAMSPAPMKGNCTKGMDRWSRTVRTRKRTHEQQSDGRRRKVVRIEGLREARFSN